MAQEEERVKIIFDTNAKQASGDVNKLGSSIDNATNATNENNDAVEQGNVAYKTFKAQLREANQELQKQIQLTGESSQETIKAAKAVADLKDQMGFASDLADSFNPDQKMKALGAASAVAGTALTGVTSGMALFGDQSKDTQAQLLKVQAAMAFSDSISQLSNIGDQFAILKTTVKDTWTALTTAKAVDTAATATNTGAQAANATAVVAETAVVSGSTVATTAATIATNLWNASLAIALAPITLIIAGVAGLVLGIGYLTGAFGDFSGEQLKAEVANKKLNNSIEAQEKAFAKSNKQLELSQSLAIGMAKASGKSAVEIRNLENALINQEVAEKRLNAVKMQSIFIEARRIAGLEDATDAQKETAKKAYDSFVKANEIFNTSLDKRKQLVVTHEIEKRQIETDANEKALKAQADANEKKLKAQADANEKLKAQAKQHREDMLKEANDFFKQGQEVQKENDDADVELRKTQIDNLNNINVEAIDIDTQNAIKQDRIDKAKLKNKEAVDSALKDLGNQGVSAAKDLFAKNKNIQKGIVVAESGVALGKLAVNTVEAVSKDNAASPLTFGMPWAGIHIGQGVLGAASIISATNKQLQALGGGSAPSASGVSGGSGVRGSAPPTVAFNNTAENQIGQSVAKTQSDQPPLKVYVSESDISDAQNNVKVLVNKNVF